jgi:hypothetical protein
MKRSASDGLAKAHSKSFPDVIGEGDEANQRWHREMLRSLELVTRGHYMGETHLTTSATRMIHSARASGSDYKQFGNDTIHKGYFTATLVRV